MNNKNNKNEDNFRKALKTLVIDEPEKLEYFRDLNKEDSIPPFAPAHQIQGKTAGKPQINTGDRKRELVSDRKQPSALSKRRRYTFGMAAAAACFAVFISVAALNFSPGLIGPGVERDAPGSSEVAGPGTTEPSVEGGDPDVPGATEPGVEGGVPDDPEVAEPGAAGPGVEGVPGATEPGVEGTPGVPGATEPGVEGVPGATEPGGSGTEGDAPGSPIVIEPGVMIPTTTDEAPETDTDPIDVFAVPPSFAPETPSSIGLTESPPVQSPEAAGRGETPLPNTLSIVMFAGAAACAAIFVFLFKKRNNTIKRHNGIG